MSIQRLPLLATTVSMIALATLLPGCASDGSLFQSAPQTAEQKANASYQASLDLGDKARAEGKLEEAAGHYARAARWAPTESWPLIRLSDTLWEMKNPSEAAKVLVRAHEVDPTSTLILRNLGRAYVALNQPGKAQETYLAALAIDPNDTKILNGLAISYDLDGDHDTAQRHYHAGLDLDPYSVDLKNNLAYSLISSRDYAGAVDILEPMANSANATPRQRQNLALAYGLLGKEDDVRRVSKTDLTPAQIEQNLVVYRQLRGEPGQPDTLRHIGRPTFASGGLTTEVPPAPAAAPVAPVETAESASVASTPVGMEPIMSEPALSGVPDGAIVVEPEETPVQATRHHHEAEAAPAPAPAETVAPAPAKPEQPTEEKAQDIQPPASATSSGLGAGKIYLGSYADENSAREAWIKVWVNNSALLGSMAASIEPSQGQMALYAVGADSATSAGEVCTSLRQNGVSCGVSQ